MIVIVVKPVYDADTKGIGIAKGTIFNTCQVEVFGKGEIAFGFDDGIQFQQVFAQVIPFFQVIQGFFPKCVTTCCIQYRYRVGEVREVIVRNRQRHLAAMRFQVPAQCRVYRKKRFFPGWLTSFLFHDFECKQSLLIAAGKLFQNPI